MFSIKQQKPTLLDTFWLLLKFIIHTHQQKKFTIQTKLQCPTSAFNQKKKNRDCPYLDDGGDAKMKRTNEL